MTELFDSIKHEMIFAGENWTDVTADVLVAPGTRWSKGIISNAPAARVANTGKLTLYLDNSESNSATQLGYYSPGNANVRSGFSTGIRYRLTFTKEGLDYIKFYGRIDDIDPQPGTLQSRRTKVIVTDYMGMATKHTLSLLSFTTSKRLDEVMPLITANGAFEPLATDYATGISTFPTVFDTTRNTTKMVSEFQKLAMSEQAYIYVKANGSTGETLTSENRETRTGAANTLLPTSNVESDVLLMETGDNLLLETGDDILLNQTQSASFSSTMLPKSIISWGKQVFNQVRGSSFPREVGTANEILFTLQTIVSLAGGEVADPVRISYRDPGGSPAKVSGKNMVTPVASTDYTANTQEDGGGTDLTSDLGIAITFGTEGAEYTLTNNSGFTMFVTLFQLRGIKILTFDPTTVISEDTTSQATHGIIPLVLDQAYQDDPVIAGNFISTYLIKHKDPKILAEKLFFNTANNSMNMFGFLILAEPGERSEFIETLSGLSGDWFINGYEAAIIADSYVEYGLIVLDASVVDYWQLSVSQLDTETILAIG